MLRLLFFLRSVMFPAVIGGIIFVSAGRCDFPFVWMILAVMVTWYGLLAAFADAGLMQERQTPGAGNQDRLTRGLGGLLLMAHWVLAGLDIGRFHWSSVSSSVQIAGVVGYGLALSVNFWALQANRFYSSVVRIQSDRGQVVIDGGPYRFVRHPGYSATLCAMFAGGIALGSWLAMLTVLGFAALFLRRTLIEDRLLLAELPGYREYALRVRHRLVPGVF